MTINQANTIVKSLIGEDDFHDVEDILTSYYNIAQKQIATTVSPIVKCYDAQCNTVITLPDDLYRLYCVTGGYERIDRTHIIIKGDATARVIYYAYPSELYDDTDINTAFEVDAEAQAAIPYYAAAQTVLADSDMRRYYAFMDMYNGILSNISVQNAQSSVIKIVAPEEM